MKGEMEEKMKKNKMKICLILAIFCGAFSPSKGSFMRDILDLLSRIERTEDPLILAQKKMHFESLLNRIEQNNPGKKEAISEISEEYLDLKKRLRKGKSLMPEGEEIYNKLIRTVEQLADQ
jgi:hypothetical protein